MNEEECEEMVPTVERRHDNERPHASARTLELLEQFKWETFKYAPYSPDLAPSDQHLFPPPQNIFGQPGWSLRSDHETNSVVQDRLAVTFLDEGI